MFYFRFWLYRLIKPFVKPIAPEKAFKYHYTGLFLYVVISANLMIYAFHLRKEARNVMDEDEDFNLTGLDKLKSRLAKHDRDVKKIVHLSGFNVHTEEFNLKDYKDERERIRLEKYEKDKKAALI